ncbi:MAG: heme-binding protein [Actinomycetes bacterium]
MRELKSLSHVDARRIAEFILASASTDGDRAVTVCVSDVFGDPLLVERTDGASGRTVKFAIAKARQAALTGQATAHEAHTLLPSGEWQEKTGDVHRKDGNLRTDNPTYVSLSGGYPVIVGGLTVGGVGVSGRAQLDDHSLAQDGVEKWVSSQTA